MQIVHIEANGKEASLLSKTNANVETMIGDAKAVKGAIVRNISLTTEEETKEIKIIVNRWIFEGG